jgi:RNA methyltransferase, TrmH family
MTFHSLTSKDNPLLKTFRLVAACAPRAPKELVIAEGIRILEEVEQAGCDIESVIVSEDFGPAPREKDLLDRWRARRLHVCQTEGSLFQSISTVRTPQGAIALVRVPDQELHSFAPGPNPLILFSCRIQDPGNLGTLIRTAAAAGVALVCTSAGTVSARNPKSIRASAGAFFRLPVIEQVAIPDFKRFCALHSVRPYRTHARQGTIYTEADLKSSCAILLGNEGAGMDETEFSDFPAIRIPMAEDVESLNVAIAGAIILFEASRQRLNM